MAGHQMLVIYVKKLVNTEKKSDKYKLKCTTGKEELHRYIHI